MCRLCCRAQLHFSSSIGFFLHIVSFDERKADNRAQHKKTADFQSSIVWRVATEIRVSTPPLQNFNRNSAVSWFELIMLHTWYLIGLLYNWANRSRRHISQLNESRIVTWSVIKTELLSESTQCPNLVTFSQFLIYCTHHFPAIRKQPDRDPNCRVHRNFPSLQSSHFPSSADDTSPGKSICAVHRVALLATFSIFGSCPYHSRRYLCTTSAACCQQLSMDRGKKHKDKLYDWKNWWRQERRIKRGARGGTRSKRKKFFMSRRHKTMSSNESTNYRFTESAFFFRALKIHVEKKTHSLYLSGVITSYNKLIFRLFNTRV